MSSIFAKQNNLSFEQATYTLAGIGSNATTYNNGKIYTVPLVDSNGDVILVKAFSVETIVTEKIGQEEVIFNKEDFPHLSKAVLEEAAKPLNKKYLDVLIGNQNLGLQLVCETRICYQDCAQGHCVYCSKFGSGYVPLGSFGKDQPIATVLKHDTLTKASPSIQGLFF